MGTVGFLVEGELKEDVVLCKHMATKNKRPVLDIVCVRVVL